MIHFAKRKGLIVYLKDIRYKNEALFIEKLNKNVNIAQILTIFDVLAVEFGLYRVIQVRIQTNLSLKFLDLFFTEFGTQNSVYIILNLVNRI